MTTDEESDGNEKVRFYVGGISENENDFVQLQKLFERFGVVTDAYLTSKSYGFVTLAATKDSISKCMY
jgi:RNA recognition motif-containing protein